MVLAHGFGGVQVGGLQRFAIPFSEAGLTALTFDFRHFGDSSGEPRQLIDMRRQLEDWRSAIAHIRTIDEVDPARLALWGFSLSGGHVHVIAAGDSDVAACVALAPVVDGRSASFAGGIGHALRCTAAATRDVMRAATRRGEFRIRIVGDPGGPLAASEADGLVASVNRLAPDGFEWDNSMPARSIRRLPYYRPIRFAKRLQAPILYCLADEDVMAQSAAARKAAARAPYAEVKSYGCEHFDLFCSPVLEQVVEDQVEFLGRCLQVPTAPVRPNGRARRRTRTTP